MQINNKQIKTKKENFQEHKPSKRQSKLKIKSEEFESEELKSISEPKESIIYENPFQENSDIVMSGNLVYRYANDQIELEGFWSISSDMARERFSYLLLNKLDRLSCRIRVDQIETNDVNRKDDYTLYICSSNLHEAILIPNANIFNTVINYLTGEYHGFFMYYDKTIEDRFYLNFILDDNQVRITGEGTNSLGNFNLIGYLNFFHMKDEMINRNNIQSEVINLGEFRITRLYNAFNPNENYRVIKSFQHRKKTNFDDEDSI